MQTKQQVNTAGLKYDEIKKIALSNEPISRRVILSDVQVDINGQLSVEGLPVLSETGIQKQLFKILQLPVKTLNHIEKTTGADSKQALIEAVKYGLTLSSAKRVEVNVVANPLTKTVTHILPGKKDFISNKIAMQNFEIVMEKYPQLNVHDFALDNKGGIALTLKTAEEKIPKNLAGNYMEDERFNPGIT